MVEGVEGQQAQGHVRLNVAEPSPAGKPSAAGYERSKRLKWLRNAHEAAVSDTALSSRSTCINLEAVGILEPTAAYDLTARLYLPLALLSCEACGIPATLSCTQVGVAALAPTPNLIVTLALIPSLTLTLIPSLTPTLTLILSLTLPRTLILTLNLTLILFLSLTITFL